MNNNQTTQPDGEYQIALMRAVHRCSNGTQVLEANQIEQILTEFDALQARLKHAEKLVVAFEDLLLGVENHETISDTDAALILIQARKAYANYRAQSPHINRIMKE
jgi:hypothetical protein